MIRPLIIMDVANMPPAVMEAISLSDEHWAGIHNGQLLCVFGLIPMSDGGRYLWIEWTPEAFAHPFVIGRWAKKFVAEVIDRHETIHCHSSNSKWISHFGAQFIFEDPLRCVLNG